MPPKAKFTKEEVVAAALEIVKREGDAALTARALGKELKSSSRPVFTVFDSMEEVQKAVLKEAKNLYGQYVAEGLNESVAFKGVGKAYIRFASEQPKLFRLLFMKEQREIPKIDGVLGVIEDSYEKILLSIEDSYGFGRETSEEIYRHLWIYSHGIAVLCATKVCAFSPEEISGMLTEVFSGILLKFKSEGKI